MKKNILSLFIFLLLCLIFSCSNLINGIDESNNSVFNKFDSTKEIVVSGKVVVKGAVPQNLIQPDNSQKTAMPQLNSIVSKYKIAATLLDNNDERTETIKQKIFDSDETDFSIALPFGNWILEGYALDSSENEILYGIFGTSESPTIIVSSEGATPPAINIQLSPVCNAEITGKANLKIDVTGAGIKSVEVKWNESSINKVQKFKNSDNNALTEFYVTLADEHDNNENKNVGSYEIQIIFYSNSDYTVPVFTCHELINIFSNLTTNVWKNSGSCSFISDGNFKLTSAIVNKRHYYYINQSVGNDTNEGSSYLPLKHVQTAVDRIIAANDGDDYTIFLMDDYMADGTESYIDDETTPSVVYINNSSGSKPFKLKIQSQTDTQYRIDANYYSARVIYLIGGEGHKVSLTLQNITISGGIVQSRGAGILAHDYTDLTISNNVTIKDNNTTVDGGTSANYGGAGIYSYQGDSSMGNTLTIDGSNIFIEGNKSVQYGGGIYVNGCGKVYISGSAYIDSNTAKFGAGIALLGDIGEATIDENVVIQKNTGNLPGSTVGYGGGIYADFNGRLDIKDNVLISENTCGSDGGGINIGYSGIINREIDISDNVKIQKNSCGSKGGGIYIGKNASVIINGGTIGGDSLEYGNKSTATNDQLGGGGIYIYTKGSLTLNDGKILNNTGVTAHCVFNECGSFTMNGGYVYHDLSDEKHKCAVFNSRNGGTGSSYKIYMSGDAHINQQNTVSIDKNFPITLTGNLTQQTSGGVNIPSAVIEMQGAEVGYAVIINDSSGNNYVASNYNKFQYATTGFIIDEDGKLELN